MKVISFINLKGGVAKTASVINTAAILAHDYRKRVLVVDADSQCNLTEFFKDGPAAFTLADLLRDIPEDPAKTRVRAAIDAANYPFVWLLPGDETLMDLDLTKVESESVNVECLLDARMKLDKDYDYCLIDCPPAFNAASAAALIASDEVVIPIKIDAFSLRGMDNITRQLANMRKINRGLKLAGLLPTMAYKSAKIQEAEAALRASGLPVFPRIRRSTKVDDMTFSGVPIIETSAHSAAAVDYRRFVVELVGKRGGASHGKV